MRDQFRRLTAEISGSNGIVLAANFSARRKRFLRFLVAGAINTLFGFAAYSICIVDGMAVGLALLAGMLSGTLFNFLTTGRYVFRELSIARFPRFVICYLLIYAINFISIELISLWLSNKIVSQAVIAFPIALLSYFLMARLVFFLEVKHSLLSILPKNK